MLAFCASLAVLSSMCRAADGHQAAIPWPHPTAGRCAGYRWVLQKEGELPLLRQGSRSAWAGGTAGEVEQLRVELRQRGDQLEGLRAEIMGLEATRNE